MSDVASTSAADSQKTLPSSDQTRKRTNSADGLAIGVAATNRGGVSISLALTNASDLTDLGLGSSASAFGRSSFSSSSKAQSGVAHVNSNITRNDQRDQSPLALGGGVMNSFFMGVGGGESHRRGSSLSSSPRAEGVAHVLKSQTSLSLRRVSSASASLQSPFGNTGLSPLRQLQPQQPRRRRSSSNNSTVSLSIGGHSRIGENELGGGIERGSITFDNSGFLFSSLGLTPHTPALPPISNGTQQKEGAAAVLSPFPPLEATALRNKGSEDAHLKKESEEEEREALLPRNAAVRRASRTLPFKGTSPENSDQSWDSGRKEAQIETPAITVTTPRKLGIMEGIDGNRNGERDNWEELQKWKGHDKKEADEGTTPLGGALGTKSKKSPASRTQVSPKHLAAMASPAASSSSYFSSPFSPSFLLNSLDLDTDVDKLGIYELESLMTTLNKSLPAPVEANPQPSTPSDAQETSISTRKLLLQSKRASVEKRLSLLKAAPTEIEAQHKTQEGEIHTNEGVEIRSETDSNLLHVKTAVGSDVKNTSDVKKTDGIAKNPPSTKDDPAESNTDRNLDSETKVDDIASSEKKGAQVGSDRARAVAHVEEETSSSDSRAIEKQPTATEQPTAMQLIWERLQKKRDEEAKKEPAATAAPSDEQKAIPMAATRPDAVTIIIKKKDGSQTVINPSSGAIKPAVADNTVNTREEGNESTIVTTTHTNSAIISAVAPSQNPPPAPSAENVTNSLPTAPAAAAAAKRSQSLRYFTSRDKGQPQQMETRTITTTIVTNGVPTVRQIQVQVPVAPLQPKITRKSYVVSTFKPSIVPRPSSFARAGHANGSGAVEGSSSSSATAGKEENNDGHAGGNNRTHNKTTTEIITPAAVGTAKAKVSENAVNSTLVTADLGSTTKEQAHANNEKRALKIVAPPLASSSPSAILVGDNKSAKLGEALGIGASWMEDLADFVSVLRSDGKAEETREGNVGKKESAATGQLQLLKKPKGKGEEVLNVNAGGSDAFTARKPTTLASATPPAVQNRTPKEDAAEPTAANRNCEDQKSASMKPATVPMGGSNNNDDNDDDELSDFDVSGCSTPPVRPLNIIAKASEEQSSAQRNPTPPINKHQKDEIRQQKEERLGLEQRRRLSAAAAVKPLVVCDVLLTAQDASLTPPNDYARRQEMALSLVSPPARPLPSFPKLESPKKRFGVAQRGPPLSQPSKHGILENEADGEVTKVERVPAAPVALPLPPAATATIAAHVNNEDRNGIKVVENKTLPIPAKKKETKVELPRAHEGAFQVSSPHPPADPPVAGKQRPVSPGLLVPTGTEPTTSGKAKEESRASEAIRVPAAAVSVTRPRTLFSPHSPDVSVVRPTGGEARRARYPVDLPDAVTLSHPPERSLFKPDPACSSEEKRTDEVGLSSVVGPPNLISEKAVGLSEGAADNTEKTNSPPHSHEVLALRKETTVATQHIPHDHALEEGSNRGGNTAEEQVGGGNRGDLSESHKEQLRPAANEGPAAGFEDKVIQKSPIQSDETAADLRGTDRSQKLVKRTISDATAVILQRAFAERYPGMPVPLSLVKWFVSANSGALMNLKRTSNANLSISDGRGQLINVENREESQGSSSLSPTSASKSNRKSSHRGSTFCSDTSLTAVGGMNSETNENPNDPNGDFANSEEAIVNPFFDTYLKFAAATKSAEENAKRLSFAVRRRTENVLQGARKSTSSSEAEQESARGRSINSEEVSGTCIRWVGDEKMSLNTHQQRVGGSFARSSNHQSVGDRGSIFTHAFELSPSSPLAPADERKAAFPSSTAAAEASAARALRSDRGSIGTAPPLGFGKVGMTFASVAAEERRISSSGGASAIANTSSAILEFGPLLRSHSGSRRSTESGSDRSVGRTEMKKNSRDDFHYKDPPDLDVVRTQEDSPRFAGGPQQHTTASPTIGSDANGFTLARARSSTATLLGAIASLNGSSAASPAFARGHSLASRSLATPDKPSPLAPPPPPAVENLDVPLPQEHSSGRRGQKEKDQEEESLTQQERLPPAECKEDVKPILVDVDRKLSSPTEDAGGGAAKEGAAVGVGFTAAPLAKRRSRRKPSVVFLGTMSLGPHFEKEEHMEGEERDGAICTITASPAAQLTHASQHVRDIVGNEKEATADLTFLRSRSIMSATKVQATNKQEGGGEDKKASETAVFEDNGRTRQASAHAYGWSDAERDMRAEREALATPMSTRGKEKGENLHDPKEADFMATNGYALSSQAGRTRKNNNVGNSLDGSAFKHPYAVDTDAFPTPAQKALQPLVAVPVREEARGVRAKEDLQHPPQAFSLEGPGGGNGGDSSPIIHHDQNVDVNAVHDAPLSPLPPQEGHSSHLRARFYPHSTNGGTSGTVDRLLLDKSLDNGGEVRGEQSDRDRISEASKQSSQLVGAAEGNRTTASAAVRVSPETEMVLFQGVWMSATEKHRRLEASRQRNEYFKQLAIEYLETHRREGADSKALDRLF